MYDCMLKCKVIIEVIQTYPFGHIATRSMLLYRCMFNGQTNESVMMSCSNTSSSFDQHVFACSTLILIRTQGCIFKIYSTNLDSVMFVTVQPFSMYLRSLEELKNAVRVDVTH